MLISRMPGHADITPDDPESFAAQLGRTLARLHSTDLGVAAELDTVFEHRGYRARLSGPTAALVDSLWERRIVAAPMVLTHGDYQSSNVVWDHGTVSGVIDWEGAARGPAGYDIGWCRFDLYLLYGRTLPEIFLAAYEAAGGVSLDEPWLWDAWTLARSHRSVEDWVPNYRDLGRRDLTAAELRRRHTSWTEETLRRSAD